MNTLTFAIIANSDVALFGIFLFLVIFALVIVFIYGIWLERRKGSLSPYSRLPMRRGADLSYDTSEKVLKYLYYLHEYDNRIFDLKKAAVCRETGCIFPDALSWYDIIKIDWSFLQKRYPGHYVSWGSLTSEQQEIVRDAHESLEGFQTEFSSPIPQPKNIEAKYAFTKPGPLYVDLTTKVLLGWKIVPRTECEVMIVQKPKR